MRTARAGVAAVTLLALAGCSWFCKGPACEDPARRHTQADVSAAAFGRSLEAWYAEHAPVPPDLDRDRYLAALRQAHPRPDEIDWVLAHYRVEARAAGQHVGLLLCEPGTGAKVLEDWSCTLNRVDDRAWQRPDPAPCAFTADLATLCR